MNILIAALFIFSLDGATPGSSPRDLPTQGRSLVSGDVVVGLAAVPGAKRAECGWYEVVDVPPPETHTNEVAYLSGYAFDAASDTATEQWGIEWIPPPVVQYSKLRIIVACKQAGCWSPGLKEWIAASGYEDEWGAAQELSSDYDGFDAIVEAVRTALSLTQEQVEAILEAARL